MERNNRRPMPMGGMPTARIVSLCLARLDASPLPASDPVRLDLELELIALRQRVRARDRAAARDRPMLN